MKLRSGYSFRVAFGHLADVAEANPWSFMPLTDRASTFGYVNWEKMAKKAGKKPVYGIELAVTPSINEKKPTVNHMTFLAKNSLGPTNRLLNIATAQFRYQPNLTVEDVNRIDTNEIAILLGRKPDLERIEVRPGMYLDVGPATPKPLIAWAREKGVPMVASSDNFYPTAEDFQAYEVMIGRGANSQTYAQHVLSQPEWMSLRHDPELWANTERLATEMKAGLVQAKLMVPEHPATLEELCRRGAVKLGCDLADPVYSERLERELQLIETKKFEDYFFIIADLIAYAKTVMFVGPARGSSCGSLVCYLLGITTIDPIPHGLLFERFIDITRADLPDIDIDFSDERRHFVFDYLNDKYGSDHVARLGTVAVYKPRSAINEAGAALRVPKWRVEQFTASIIDRSGGDSRALQGVEDTFADTEAGRALIAEFPELGVAMRMEGHPRHYSQHAAGVIVTEQPVEDHVAIDSRTGATMCDKKDAEALNLLKIDALGLIQLSVFEDCLEMIGKPHDWLVNLPLDDPAAFNVLNEQRWAGIFQWNGKALQSLTQQFHVTEFEDMVAVTALARPGPLSSGGASSWVERKNGRELIRYPHDSLAPYLEQTKGIVVYQEQVMQIGREIGQLTWDDVTALRKAMSKSLGKEYFDQFGDRFKAGAIKNGLPPEMLDQFWTDLCQMGAWAFNRSHSVAYGIVSYWCAYLKAHHPVQFAAATLTHEKVPEKQLKLLREMAKEGTEYVPVDPLRSSDKWEVHGDKLLGPLSNVKGLGPKTVNEILAARKNGLPFPKKAAKLLENPKTTIDDLYPVATRIKQLVPDLIEAGLITPKTDLVDIQPNGREDEVLVIVKAQEINTRDHNETTALAKRGYKMQGQTQYLNLVLEDDTDRILARVDRRTYERVGQPIVEKGAPGKSIWALKGRTTKDFRLINIKRAKYIGSME